jgi:hypothetical protein
MVARPFAPRLAEYSELSKFHDLRAIQQEFLVLSLSHTRRSLYGLRIAQPQIVLYLVTWVFRHDSRPFPKSPRSADLVCRLTLSTTSLLSLILRQALRDV